MDKIQAQALAVELAKIAVGSPSGSLSVYPNTQSANDIADFIESLTDRLAAQ